MSEPYSEDYIRQAREAFHDPTSMQWLNVEKGSDSSRWLATVDALHTRLAAAEARAEGAEAALRECVDALEYDAIPQVGDYFTEKYELRETVAKCRAILPPEPDATPAPTPPATESHAEAKPDVCPKCGSDARGFVRPGCGLHEHEWHDSPEPEPATPPPAPASGERCPTCGSEFAGVFLSDHGRPCDSGWHYHTPPREGGKGGES